MGTSMAPQFANLYLHVLENPILKEFRDHILLYKRYIDDIFIVIKGPRHIADIIM